MVSLNGGIKFGDHFSVDATVKSPLAIVSHAHSDHLRGHEKIIATAPTLDLARLQYKRFEGINLDYHTPIEIGPAKVELVPAGHILGSAQVIIDWRGERIVYTGDFKLEENLTCLKAEIHHCDVLLIDTTYGKPRYNFPSFAACKEMLLEFVDKNLKAGITPIILAYSIGKSQEGMKILSNEGFEIEAFENTYNAAMVYSRHGIEIKNISEFKEKPTKGRVLFMPPGSMKNTNTYGWGRFRTCLLSGWALDRAYGSRGGNGMGIPFSDHASFDDIVRYVETAKPRKVFTLFGPPDIAEYLNRIGFKAEDAHFNSGHSFGKKNAINLDLFS